jgi:organic radical activating enzyme
MKFTEYLESLCESFRAIYIQLGLRCALRCKHCSVYAGPKRREELPMPVALAVIRDFATLSTAKTVVFTGGEPFLDLERLRTVLSEVARFPELNTLVLTSSHWARSASEASEVMQSLPPIALLAVSADEYHEEFVPRSNLRHAIVAAREVGTNVLLSIAQHGKEDGYAAGLRSFLGEEIWSGIEVDIVRVMPLGRAKTYGIGGFNSTPVHLPKGACDVVGTPVVVSNGNVVACCQIDATNDALRRSNSFYDLGHVPSDPLAVLQQRFEQDDLMQALRVWGPSGLVTLLRSNGIHPKLGSSYHGICLLCRDLLTDPENVAALRKILKEQTLRREIWISRMLRYGQLRPCPAEAVLCE